MGSGEADTTVLVLAAAHQRKRCLTPVPSKAQVTNTHIRLSEVGVLLVTLVRVANTLLTN